MKRIKDYSSMFFFSITFTGRLCRGEVEEKCGTIEAMGERISGLGLVMFYDKIDVSRTYIMLVEIIII
jgi:hypothetical protein